MQYRYRGDEVDSRANTVGRAKQQLWQQVGPALSLGPGATLKHRNLSIIDRPLSAPVSNIADASSESQIWRATPPLNRLIVFGHRLLGCTAGIGLTQTDRQTCRRLCTYVIGRCGFLLGFKRTELIITTLGGSGGREVGRVADADFCTATTTAVFC